MCRVCLADKEEKLRRRRDNEGRLRARKKGEPPPEEATATMPAAVLAIVTDFGAYLTGFSQGVNTSDMRTRWLRAVEALAAHIHDKKALTGVHNTERRTPAHHDLLHLLTPPHPLRRTARCRCATCS